MKLAYELVRYLSMVLFWEIANIFFASVEKELGSDNIINQAAVVFPYERLEIKFKICFKDRQQVIDLSF